MPGLGDAPGNAAPMSHAEDQGSFSVQWFQGHRLMISRKKAQKLK
jgi:hypothetical protein